MSKCLFWRSRRKIQICFCSKCEAGLCFFLRKSFVEMKRNRCYNYNLLNFFFCLYQNILTNFLKSSCFVWWLNDAVIYWIYHDNIKSALWCVHMRSSRVKHEFNVLSTKDIILRVRTSRKLSMLCQFMRLSLYNLTDQENLDTMRSKNCIVIIDFALQLIVD